MPYNQPDNRGHFEKFGGKYVPETLIPAINELEQLYSEVKDDSVFQDELSSLLKHYSGRPTPLYFARRISEELDFNIYLKREDLNHTGAHKINNALGQILLAQRMGKKRIIAETGAGMHGVATAKGDLVMGWRRVAAAGKGRKVNHVTHAIAIDIIVKEIGCAITIAVGAVGPGGTTNAVKDGIFERAGFGRIAIPLPAVKGEASDLLQVS